MSETVIKATLSNSEHDDCPGDRCSLLLAAQLFYMHTCINKKKKNFCFYCGE